MKKNYITVILFFATGTLFFSCCKKDKNVDDPYTDRKMPKEMYDYGYFLPGTYWIYEDSVSGAIDSVWVWDAYKEIDTIPKDNANGLEPGIYDLFQVQTTSSYFNADYYYWSNSSRIGLNRYYQIRREEIKTGSVLETITLFYPPDIGFNGYLGLDTITISTFNESFTIGVLTFIKVIGVHQTKNITEGDFKTDFYHSKNTGIVKKEIPNRNEYWKLIRYHITQ